MLLSSLDINPGVAQCQGNPRQAIEPGPDLDSVVEAVGLRVEKSASQLESISRRVGFGSIDRIRPAFVRAYDQTLQRLWRIARTER